MALRLLVSFLPVIIRVQVQEYGLRIDMIEGQEVTEPRMLVTVVKLMPQDR